MRIPFTNLDVGLGLKINKVDKASRDAVMGKMADTIPPWLDNQRNWWWIRKGDYKALLGSYKSWIYVCSNKNASTFAQQQLKLFVTKEAKDEKLLVKTKAIVPAIRKQIYSNSAITSLQCVTKAMDVEEVTEHPFLDLMKNVNPFMNRFELFEMTDLHQELCGNAYWYIVKNQLGLPLEIWLLDPSKVFIVPSKEKWIIGYVYRRDDGLEIPFLPEEIIHFKFPNPNDYYYGWSPLQAMLSSYNLNEAYNQREAALQKNQGVPPIALVPPKDSVYGDADYKRILRRWNQTYGNTNNVGKTAWLEGGFDVKILQGTGAKQDISNLLGRKWTREEIADAYGVPMSKLTSESVNRANAESGDYSYLKDTINPRCIRNVEKLNERLMPMFDQRLFLMYVDVIPEDKEFILKERESLISSNVRSVNEVRKELGDEEVEWGKYPIVSQTMVPYTGEKPEPAPAPGQGKQPGQMEDEIKLGGKDKGKKKKPYNPEDVFGDEEGQLTEEQKEFLAEKIATAMMGR